MHSDVSSNASSNAIVIITMVLIIIDRSDNYQLNAISYEKKWIDDKGGIEKKK